MYFIIHYPKAFLPTIKELLKSESCVSFTRRKASRKVSDPYDCKLLLYKLFFRSYLLASSEDKGLILRIRFREFYF